MKQLFLVGLSFLFLNSGRSASVDSIEVFSNSMHRNIKAVVITPANYSKKNKHFPVVYLLHGAFGDYSNWIQKSPHIAQLADEYEMILVCPDGARTSWYFDSPIDSNYRFETFISTEVPQYIDTHYKTIPDRKGRAIAGLSMGGQGSLFTAFRHAETFSACGSMSGAMLVNFITSGYDVEKRLGDTANNKYWNDWSVYNVIEHYPKDSLDIILDCGTEDKILGMSRAVHEKLNKLKIPHTYAESPGAHNFQYWAKAIDYQLLFFKQHFTRLLPAKGNP